MSGIVQVHKEGICGIVNPAGIYFTAEGLPDRNGKPGKALRFALSNGSSKFGINSWPELLLTAVPKDESPNEKKNCIL